MTDKPFTQKTMPEGYISAFPLPSEEELSKFYRDLYYQERPTSTYQNTYSEDEINHKKLRAEALIHSILKCLNKRDGSSQSFIEVGYGEGFVLQAALLRKFKVSGVDFSDFAIKSFHPNLVDFIEAGVTSRSQ
jgi:hypothetical protein